MIVFWLTKIELKPLDFLRWHHAAGCWCYHQCGKSVAAWRHSSCKPRLSCWSNVSYCTHLWIPPTALSQQDQVKSNITVGFFIVLYRIWALFTGTNEDKILSRALLEIFIKIGGFKPSFFCRFNWVFQKYFLSANSYSWWNFHSFDRSQHILLYRNKIFSF